eukprot:TRINITY_DN2605_c0_g4_i1.p1 TRINITY_DN2605_c0_g4~~TRINITY_DN2605_c0_g4_i1.p1  ORF type:complete len:503 (-),score=60.79 TRINITY_DN2605_c0_g4_i1:340-1848(-)
MVSQKSLEFQLDKLLGDTSFEMDVDALIQAPDRAFLDSYLTSLQAKNGPMDVQPQEGVEQYQGNVFSTFSSAPITTGAFNDTAAAKTGPQIITTGDYSDLQLADLAWDAEEEEVQGNNIDPSVIDKNKQRKRRIRTQQQQNQNKLAQQRYRERRKQKYSEMEAMVDEMQVQVDTLKQVEQQFEEMSGQKDLLMQRVKEQENEIGRLRNQVHQLTLRGGIGVADEQLQKCENAEVVAELVNEHDMEKVKQDFKKTVTSIKTILEKYNLLHDDHQEPAAGASIQEQDLQNLSQLVCRGMAACMKLYQDASPLMCVESRCSAPSTSQMERIGIVTCPIARSQWEKCLRVVRLSQSQRVDILKHRESFLENIREIYTKRDKLNLTAMGMMLPHWSKNYNPTAEGRMETVERRDFFFFSRWDAELAKVLDELRFNLREEQKAFLIFSKSIMANVLQPLQRALLLVTSYPLPADILGVANTLFSQTQIQTQNQGVSSSYSDQSASQLP